ncbi:MAG: hypothetical protein MZV65_53905 [Chromatiales bacterium]|nr:hypothetical protein [Chromatiales bacterium]
MPCIGRSSTSPAKPTRSTRARRTDLPLSPRRREPRRLDRHGRRLLPQPAGPGPRKPEDGPRRLGFRSSRPNTRTGTSPAGGACSAGTADRSQPPLGAYVTLKLFERFGDLEVLRQAYPALQRWHDFWTARRPDGQARRDGNGDGLLEWGLGPRPDRQGAAVLGAERHGPDEGRPGVGAGRPAELGGRVVQRGVRYPVPELPRPQHALRPGRLVPGRDGRRPRPAGRRRALPRRVRLR